MRQREKEGERRREQERKDDRKGRGKWQEEGRGAHSGDGEPQWQLSWRVPPPPGGHYLPAPLAGNTAASKGSQILGITLTTILQGRKEGLSRPRKLFKCTPLSSDGVRIQTLLLHAASGRI